MSIEQPEIVVCALYKFTALDQAASFRDRLHNTLENYNILGTILVASEGINGTIAGSRNDIDRFLGWLKSQHGLSDIEVKESTNLHPPFKRTRVKLKKEIVTMGVENIDPRSSAGTYIEPDKWNDLLDDPEVLVIDTRNEYEINVGRFENSINPHTRNFREFPAFAKSQLNPGKHKKIAMYCTGGIRCEKSTAFLKQQGFDQVFHLKGGILKYLEQVPEEESKWQGECFVFDDRVTVDHRLQKGSFDQCHACRLPITDKDKQHPEYQQGVSCPYCYGNSTEQDKARYAEREKQVQLAAERNDVHIGPKVPLKI
jgi:UPF0176 protein